MNKLSRNKKILILITGVCLIVLVYIWQKNEQLNYNIQLIEEGDGQIEYRVHPWLKKLPQPVKGFSEKLIGKTIIGVYFQGNQEADLTLLESLSSLEELDLSRIANVDVDKLKKLKSLKKLYLVGCEISDFSFIKDLKHLEELGVDRGQLTNFSSFKGLSQLKIVWVMIRSISKQRESLKKEFHKVLPNCELLFSNY